MQDSLAVTQSLPKQTQKPQRGGHGLMGQTTYRATHSGFKGVLRLKTDFCVLRPCATWIEQLRVFITMALWRKTADFFLVGVFVWIRHFFVELFLDQIWDHLVCLRCTPGLGLDC